MADLQLRELVDELVRLETELTVIKSDIDALYELLADQHGTDSSGPARTEPRSVLEATELASTLAVGGTWCAGGLREAGVQVGEA